MNVNKAREFFSSYFDGTLEPGLKQTFERRLATDAIVQAEYRAFERTMGALDAMREIEVDVPSDLNERIQARLDKHVYDQRSSEKPAMFAWWKGLVVAGIGGLAIFGAFQSLNSTTGNATGDILGSSTPATIEVPMKVELVDGKPTLFFRPTGKRTVVIRDAIDNTVRQSVDLDSNMLRSALTNSGSQASLTSVDPGDGSSPLVVAIPGSSAKAYKSGQGTMQDFVLAMADHYGVTVTLETSSLERMVVWSFDTNDPIADATKALKDAKFSIAERYSGVISIQEHN